MDSDPHLRKPHFPRKGGFIELPYLSRHAVKYSLLFLIFFAMAIVVFYPLALNMGSTIPGTGGDAYQNLWDIWWVGYATFTLHASIWYTPLVFPPLGASLVFQTMMPIGSLISAIFQPLGLTVAYDIMFFVSFAASALAVFVLAHYLTKNSYASFIAGTIFSFSAFHVAHAVSHIDWMFIAFAPLSIYFFLRILDAGKKTEYWAALGLGVSFVLSAFMGDIQQAIIVLISFAAISVVYLALQRNRILNINFLKSMGIALAVALAAGSFGFVPIIQAITAPNALSTINMLNTVQNEQAWSVNLLSFFVPSPFNGILNGNASVNSTIFGPDPTETVAYIGYSALALALYAVYKRPRKALLWLFLVIVFGWFALGPSLQIGGVQTGIPTLYSLYRSVPLLNVLREPGRFDLIVSIAFSVLAAIGIKTLFEARKFSSNYKIVLSAAVVAIYVAEASGIMVGAVAAASTTSVNVPQVYYGIGQTAGNFTVLNLPALPNPYSNTPALYQGKALFYTTVTRKPTVSGYLTRQNNTETAYLLNIPLIVQAYNLQVGGNMTFASPISQNYTKQTLLSLYNYNVGIVALDAAAYNPVQLSKLVGYMTSLFGTPIQSNSTLVFSPGRAVDASLFRDYVSYPILSQWGSTYAFINGSERTMWIPLQYGAIITYAPYANTTNVDQKIVGGVAGYVNTTVSLIAKSTAQPLALYLSSLDQYGRVHRLAQFNLTSALSVYTANLVLASGVTAPNTFFFTPSSETNTSYALVSNITFSRRS